MKILMTCVTRTIDHIPHRACSNYKYVKYVYVDTRNRQILHRSQELKRERKWEGERKKEKRSRSGNSL